MKSYKKILSAIMAMVMIFTITGCSGSNSSDSSSDENSSSASENADSNAAADSDESSADDESASTGDDSAADSSDDSADENAVLAADYFDSTPLDDMNAVVMTVNGNDITLEEYRYYFLNLKSSFDYGDDSYWNGSSEEDVQSKLDSLKSQVQTYIQNNYAVEAFAADNNVTLTAEEEKETEKNFNDDKKEYMTENSLDDAGWQEYLDSMNCTENLYIKSSKRRDLEYKLIRTLYEDDFKKNMLSEYVMAKHILIKAADDYDAKEIPEDATDEEIEKINAENAELKKEANKEKYALAEEVLQKAKDGEDFDKLISEYNEDPGETANDDGSYDGYFFTTGEMVEEFETAAFALGENEISDIVETSYGYHIIKRVPISDDYLEKNIVDIMMTNDDYYSKYATAAKEFVDNVDVEFNSDVYDKINIFSLT